MGGKGPSGFEPSQKQSIGVIQTQGMICAIISSTSAPIESAVEAGGGGLKHISLKNQVLNYNCYMK
jgi:hypothetical protein